MSWKKVLRFLEHYERDLSPASWFGSYVGGWIVLRFGLVFVALFPAYWTSYSWVVLARALALFLIADILLAITAIVFVTKKPEEMFRSVVLTFASYVQLSVAFGSLASMVWCHVSPPLPSPDAGWYFAFTLMTTVGSAFQPIDWQGRVFVIIEQVIGLYFVAVLLGTFVAWASSLPFNEPSETP